MATPKESIEMVDVFVDKYDAQDEKNLFIGLNGKAYLLPVGKTSKVPKPVADQISRMKRARAAADNRIDEMTEATADMERKLL